MRSPGLQLSVQNISQTINSTNIVLNINISTLHPNLQIHQSIDFLYLFETTFEFRTQKLNSKSNRK